MTNKRKMTIIDWLRHAINAGTLDAEKGDKGNPYKRGTELHDAYERGYDRERKGKKRWKR